MWPTNKAKEAMCPRNPAVALMKNGRWIEDWDKMKEELVCTVSVLGGYYRVSLGEMPLEHKYDKKYDDQTAKNRVFEAVLEGHTNGPIRIE